MSNSWIEEEEAAILADSKKFIKGRRFDNIILLKFSLILLCVFFYTPCAEAKVRIAQSIQRVEGRTFKCTHCRTNQWQDAKNADWSGRYYCAHCGKEL